MTDIICFDLGGSSLKYGYGNAKQGLLHYDAVIHKEKTLKGLETLFANVLARLNETGRTFTALSIATPGILNPHTGRIMGSTPNLPYLQGVNLKEMLFDLSQLPIYIENDANLMTLAESYACTTDTVLGITIGSGIGTGLVVKHKIFSGEYFRAMEAGHMVIVPNGRQCLCGKRGCFEAYCSSDSMRRIIYQQFPDMDGLNILKILSSDSPAVIKAIEKVLDLFALALSNLVMITDPGTIVIGGGVIEIEQFNFDYLKKKTLSFLTSEFKECEIKKAVYGNKAGCMGALALGIGTIDRFP